MISDITTTMRNHGVYPNIIATVTTKHEIEFKPKDILDLLANCGSDDMAKIVNELGKIFNKQQMVEAYAVNDFDEHGKEFIDNMYYFMNKDPLI